MLLAGKAQADRMASRHLATPDGEVLSGGPVDPRSCGCGHAAACRRLRSSARRTAVDRGYRWVAGHRSLVSKLVPAAAKQRADALIARRRAADA